MGAMVDRVEFRAFYDRHVRFVWRVLLRLGVAENDVRDAVQDVFVVVHRKLGEFEGRSKETTWLFAICMKVAADRRRLAHGRRELLTTVPHPSEENADIAALVDRRRAGALLEEFLERMCQEQRIVFVLFELDEMTGEEIASLLDVPVGTVRSRLRLAREAFQRFVARLRARQRSDDSDVLRAREASG